MPADLAVIGLGHLGLPLAQAATAAGIGTIGYDPDPHTAALSGADGPLSATELRRLLSAGFRTTTDPTALGRVRTAVLCAPTPSARTAPWTSPPSPTPPAPWRHSCARTPR